MRNQVSRVTQVILQVCLPGSGEMCVAYVLSALCVTSRVA